MPLILLASLAAALLPTISVPAVSLAGDPTPPGRILLSTRGDNNIVIADAVSLATIATLDAGLGAHELAASRDNLLAIGSAYGGPGQGHNPPDNRLCIVDLAASTLKHTVTLEGVKRPNDIAFLGNTHTAAVTVEMPPHLFLIDAEKGVVIDRIKLDHPAGHMLAASPDGSTVYVSHVVAGLVSVIDVPARKVVTTIPAAPGAEGMAISPDGSRLWVANNRSHSISIIDTAARTVVQTLKVEGFPFRVRFSPGGAHVAVSCPGSNEIALFDAATLEPLPRVSLRQDAGPAPQPTSLAFAGDGLVVVCGGTGELVRITTDDWKVQSRAPTGPIPDGLTTFHLPAPPPPPATRPSAPKS